MRTIYLDVIFVENVGPFNAGDKITSIGVTNGVLWMTNGFRSFQHSVPQEVLDNHHLWDAKQVSVHTLSD